MASAKALRYTCSENRKKGQCGWDWVSKRERGYVDSERSRADLTELCFSSPVHQAVLMRVRARYILVKQFLFVLLQTSQSL